MTMTTRIRKVMMTLMTIHHTPYNNKPYERGEDEAALRRKWTTAVGG
jgi:hypothetical protein